MQETLTTLTDKFGAISETYAHSFGAISIVARKKWRENRVEYCICIFQGMV